MNTWAKQASEEILGELNKIILSMIAREEMDSPRSERASIERKKFMDSK